RTRERENAFDPEAVSQEVGSDLTDHETSTGLTAVQIRDRRECQCYQRRNRRAADDRMPTYHPPTSADQAVPACADRPARPKTFQVVGQFPRRGIPAARTLGETP